MTILLVMTQDAVGEDSNIWAAGTTHTASDVFADSLFARGVATAPFMSSPPVLARNSEDGYALVLRNGIATQLTGAWEDLRFPASSINPAGATSPATVDETVTGFSGTLLFAGNAENIIAGVAQMPHGWRAGSTIRPHIHWSLPVGSANAVAWEFYYRHLGFPSDTAGDWVGPIAGTLAAGDQTVSDSHIITDFGDMSMAGKRESSMICWQIRRQGGTDANAGTARLFEFDIHYQIDKQGTASEIPGAV